ncbi:MAG: hypothetical protein SWX82_17400 [Cyanobacteriota bacterium]|nr:hypothetical protein [Cyanobacteriota bacterium]
MQRIIFDDLGAFAIAIQHSTLSTTVMVSLHGVCAFDCRPHSSVLVKSGDSEIE